MTEVQLYKPTPISPASLRMQPFLKLSLQDCLKKKKILYFYSYYSKNNDSF